jgi:tellurium resistance protein TerD
VSNLFIHLVHDTSDAESMRYDLANDALTETAMNFAASHRNNGEWTFYALGHEHAARRHVLAKGQV